MSSPGERPIPIVAVVGRPNVGKSTLVNRLAGRRQAIAHETEGVTRDRIDVPVTWGDRAFVLVDTGGFVPRAAGLEAAVVEQAQRAMRSADLILLVVDVTTGITEQDLALARELRRAVARSLARRQQARQSGPPSGALRRRVPWDGARRAHAGICTSRARVR